jgi:hypothetical protein
MRRLLLLGALFLPMLAPGSTLAGTCPALDPGVVDRDSYRLGEFLDFYGHYHDFADPGTVTIRFDRTSDGAVRELTAANSPDGSWYLRPTFDSPEDLGRWHVTVVVTQTGDVDTCTDRVTIRSRSAVPDTATAEERLEPVDAWGAIVLAVGGLTAMLTGHRRRGNNRQSRT